MLDLVGGAKCHQFKANLTNNLKFLKFKTKAIDVHHFFFSHFYRYCTYLSDYFSFGLDIILRNIILVA